MNHPSLMNHFLVAIIIFQVSCQEDDHHHEEEHDHHDHIEQSSENWAYGMLATLCVSLLGFVVSAIILLFQKKKEDMKTILKILVAFAVGSLIGDAFLHLIPHSFHDHSSHDDHAEDEPILEEEEGEEYNGLTLGLMLVLGFFVFYLIEKGMFLLISNSETDQQEGANNNRIIAVQTDTNLDPKNEEPKTLSFREQIFTRNAWKNKTSIGYLNLVSDMLHNILDGLAIGILFSTGNYTSAVQSLIAIILHEIAQEIGDTCILIQEKFYPYQTLFCNGAVNLTALIGAIIGLSIGNIENQNYMTMFVAGNFIYLGAVDLLPDIQKEKSAKQSVYHTIAIVMGFTIMIGISLYEHSQ